MNSSCQVFTRWGRVGERGQSSLTGPLPPTAAIATFKKTFKSKSSADWENRFTMTARAGKYPLLFGYYDLFSTGKYTWIERSFEEHKPVEKSEEKEEVIIPDSKLEVAVQVYCYLHPIQTIY